MLLMILEGILDPVELMEVAMVVRILKEMDDTPEKTLHSIKLSSLHVPLGVSIRLAGDRLPYVKFPRYDFRS